MAERRANVLEMARESDPIARELLAYHIAEIDRAVAARLPRNPAAEGERAAVDEGVAFVDRQGRPC